MKGENQSTLSLNSATRAGSSPGLESSLASLATLGECHDHSCIDRKLNTPSSHTLGSSFTNQGEGNNQRKKKHTHILRYSQIIRLDIWGMHYYYYCFSFLFCNREWLLEGERRRFRSNDSRLDFDHIIVAVCDVSNGKLDLHFLPLNCVQSNHFVHNFEAHYNYTQNFGLVWS